MNTTTNSGQQEAHPLELLFDGAVPREQVLLDTGSVVARLQGLHDGFEAVESRYLLFQLLALLVELG